MEKQQQVGLNELLEAGVHFGHQTRRWNPKMGKFIFTERNGIHIIDLQKTLGKLEQASDFIVDVAASGKKILMVGTRSKLLKQSQLKLSDLILSTFPHVGLEVL